MKIFNTISKLFITRKITEAIKYVNNPNNIELDLTKYNDIIDEIFIYINLNIKKLKINKLDDYSKLKRFNNLEELEIEHLSLNDLIALSETNIKKLKFKSTSISLEAALRCGVTSINTYNGAKFYYKNIEGVLIDETRKKPKKGILTITSKDLQKDKIMQITSDINPNDYFQIIINSGANYCQFYITGDRISMFDANVSDIPQFLKLYNYLISKNYKISSLSVNLNNCNINSDIESYANLHKLAKENHEISTQVKFYPKSYKEIGYFYKKLKSLNIDMQKFTVNIDTLNKYSSNFNYRELKQIEDETNFIMLYGESERRDINVDQLVSLRESLKWFRELVNNNELSPCEKLLFAYDILKTFEYKKETGLDVSLSRSPHEVMEGDKIVCAGYSNLLTEVIRDIDPGIGIISSHVVVFRDNKHINHDRNVVRIDDDKYNIHGLFLLDATWDSVKTQKEDLEILGPNYNALDLYRFFLVPFESYSEVFHDNALQDFLINEIKSSNYIDNEQYRDRLKLFGTEVSNKTVKEYIMNPQIMKKNDFLEMLKNVRKIEGYTESEALSDIERINELHQGLNGENIFRSK